jgi:hypothetical protein
MKKTNILILGIIIILIILVIWLFPSQKKVDVNDLAFICQDYGGELINDECLISDQVVPVEELNRWSDLIVTCQNKGKYLGKGECQIDKEIYQLEMVPMFDDQEYMTYISELRTEMKDSCQNYGGKWLGGNLLDEFTWECEVDGEILVGGEWETLEAMKTSCAEYNGSWLGGEDFECMIDGRAYPGNWERYFSLKNSCEEVNGIWLSDSWQCDINGDLYIDGFWERIEEMKDSCESYGGTWIGGTNFECQVFEDNYTNKQWVRVSAKDRMAEACRAEGGNWLEKELECEGLPLQWCIDIEQELDEIKGLGFKEKASTCRYSSDPNCLEEFVTVCDLYLEKN